MYKQTQKTKNGKTKNDFRFIVFPFMYEKAQKRKTKIDFRSIVFPFIYKQTHKTEKQKRLPFYRFLVNFQRTDTKKGKRKPTSILTFFVLLTTKH